MSDQTTSNPGDPIDPIDPIDLMTCSHCAFFRRVHSRTHDGECRYSPPTVPEAPGYPHMTYRQVYPGTPACAQFMTIEEWRAYRAGYLKHWTS